LFFVEGGGRKEKRGDGRGGRNEGGKGEMYYILFL
jgi:hypothetical protein